MRWLLITMATMVAMHGGAGAFQPYQAAPTGIGAYVQAVVARGSTPYSGGYAYGVVAFGESVPRPASATVRIGW